LIREYFVEQGYNPIEGLTQFYQMQAIIEKQMKIENLKEDIVYYNQIKQEAIADNNMDYAKQMDFNILSQEAELQNYQAQIKLIKAYQNEDKVEIEKLAEELNKLEKYYEVFEKLREIEFLLEPTNFLIEDLSHYIENPSIVQYCDVQFYLGVLEDGKLYAKNTEKELKDLKEEVIITEKAEEIIYAKELQEYSKFLNKRLKSKKFYSEESLEKIASLINQIKRMQEEIKE